MGVAWTALATSDHEALCTSGFEPISEPALWVWVLRAGLAPLAI